LAEKHKKFDTDGLAIVVEREFAGVTAATSFTEVMGEAELASRVCVIFGFPLFTNGIY
jgi:hypothetical protein